MTTAAQRIEWPAGTRVRCVREVEGVVRLGDEGVVLRTSGDRVIVEMSHWVIQGYRSQFKPIVRVKMGRRVEPKPIDPSHLFLINYDCSTDPFLRSFASC
jgi:hypothetical protein